MWNMFYFCFQLPDDFEVMFDEAAGEIVIGGIYLRLFIQQPAWVGSEKQNQNKEQKWRSLWHNGKDSKVFSVPSTFSGETCKRFLAQENRNVRKEGEKSHESNLQSHFTTASKRS